MSSCMIIYACFSDNSFPPSLDALLGKYFSLIDIGSSTATNINRLSVRIKVHAIPAALDEE